MRKALGLAPSILIAGIGKLERAGMRLPILLEGDPPAGGLRCRAAGIRVERRGAMLLGTAAAECNSNRPKEQAACLACKSEAAAGNSA